MTLLYIDPGDMTCRFFLLSSSSSSLSTPLFPSTHIDTTDTTYEPSIWIFIEPCIGLVCGCHPIIRGPFLAYVIKKNPSSKRSRTSAVSFKNPLPCIRQQSTHVNYLRMADVRGSRICDDDIKNPKNKI